MSNTTRQGQQPVGDQLKPVDMNAIIRARYGIGQATGIAPIPPENRAASDFIRQLYQQQRAGRTWTEEDTHNGK